MTPRHRRPVGSVTWRRCGARLSPGQRVCADCEDAIVQESAIAPVTSEDIAAHIVEAEAAPARARREQAAAAAAERAARRRDAEASSVVYYVRLGTNHIKVGTTEHLAERMVALRVVNPDDLLAVEPGGYDLEAARHRQFDRWRWRSRREDFAEAPELVEHMAAVRAENGNPWRVPTPAAGGREGGCS